MCLYETRLKNQKYRPTIKNHGIVPECKDNRQLYIQAECGWCKECRKKVANTWRVRLMEEVKAQEHGEFITFSFAPKLIEKLENEIKKKEWHGFQGDELDVNLLAAYAIRMWTERWRKKMKKAPHHWLVTELGHRNSERLHLHGIVWNTQNQTKEEFRKLIIDTWQYGNVTIGQYKENDKRAILIGSWVGEKTINYTMKYVTKLDEFHRGYKQKIFTSKGMGKNYLNENAWKHEYRGEQTNTLYRNRRGDQYALPRYYKLKLWTDEQRSQLWSIALDKNEIFVDGIKCDLNTEHGQKQLQYALEGARTTNILSGYGNHEAKNKKYIVTPIMKLEYKELLNYNTSKLVKSVTRRKIKSIHYAKKNEVITSKASRVEWYQFGEYIGSTTEAERKRNAEMQEAQKLLVSVRELRLLKAGILQYG